MRLLQFDLVGREEIMQSVIDSHARGLDAKVAAGIEKSDQPPGHPKTSAADVEHLRFGSQSLVEQSNQLFAPPLFERLSGNTQETVPRHHFPRAVLKPGHISRPN